MKVKVEVVPNAFNESGCVFIINKQVGYFSHEIGRLTSAAQLDNFLRNYEEYDGKEYKLKEQP